MASLPLIEIVKRQAILTFSKFRSSGTTSSSFEENLSKLRGIVNKITSEDVKLDIDLLKPNTTELGLERVRAPVTYIQVLDDPSLTIGIFVLRFGARLPLHDHPLMYGILKVIHGSVHIQSYSFIKDSEVNTKKKEEFEVHPSDINLSHETINRQVILSAIKEPHIVVSSTDDACVLSPLTGNLHEIHSVNGPAAFLDILSPPYETDIPGVGPRPCRYFEEIKTEILGIVEKNEEEEEMELLDEKKPLVRLLRISSPQDYWSESAPYLGP